MSGHTPGPWYVDDFRDVCAGNFALANTRIGVRGDDEEFANAHLVSAAPDGLELAEEFLAFARSGKGFAYPPGGLQKLEQFVAKARGAS